MERNITMFVGWKSTIVTSGALCLWWSWCWRPLACSAHHRVLAIIISGVRLVGDHGVLANQTDHLSDIGWKRQGGGQIIFFTNIGATNFIPLRITPTKGIPTWTYSVLSHFFGWRLLSGGSIVFKIVLWFTIWNNGVILLCGQQNMWVGYSMIQIHANTTMFVQPIFRTGCRDGYVQELWGAQTHIKQPMCLETQLYFHVLEVDDGKSWKVLEEPSLIKGANGFQLRFSL